MFSKRNIAILVNPSPHNQKTSLVADNIDMLLNGMDLKHKVFDFKWPDNLDDFSDAWIVGGDGSLNYFINRFPEITIPLSIFKGGSGNDFHWMLYRDMNLEQQVELVLEVTPRPVDAAMVNDRMFINGVGIGFDGAIVKDLQGKKKVSGKASYLLSIMKNIMGYSEKYCIISNGNERIMQECFMINVANAARYGGGFHVAPKAALNDGLLDINIVGKISPVKRMRYLPVIEKGEHLDLPFVQYRQSAGLTVDSEHEMHAHADGEYFKSNRFSIEILPGRFRFSY